MGGIMKNNKLLSVVVPVFNENEVIHLFYDRVKAVLDSLDDNDYELIFVDDGSTDESYQKLQSLAKSDSHIKLVKFSRNFGHQIAITAGIDFSKGDAVVVIDADLQDPPELIKDFILKWDDGFDVVYGIREKREGESKFKLFTATIFYRLLKYLIKIDIPVDTGDFRLMSRRIVNQFKDLKERDRFVRGLISWVGFNQVGIPYIRDKRYAGSTKYPLSKMVKLALDGITSFSTIPLRLVTLSGFFASFLAFLYGCSVFIQKVLGYTVQGWATIMVAMIFLGGVQLICLGIIGEYIGRIFNESKQRPIYVIDQIYDKQSQDITSPGIGCDS